VIGEGANGKDANHIAKAFDRLGAKFSSTAGRDMAAVSLRSLTKPKYLKPAISLFSSVLTRANFPLKALQREKNLALAAIQVGQQEPEKVASKAFFAAIYGNQAYAHLPLGTRPIVKRLTRANVTGFYSRYYVAKNVDIILVGALTTNQAKRIARQISQGLLPGQRAKRLKVAVMLTKSSFQHITFPVKQASVMLGQVGITRKNPDYFPLIVGNYAFGGLPMGSILFQQVREKRGLAYYAGSSFQPLRYRGPYMILFQTRANKASKALQVVQEALKNFMANGPTQEQLDAAKQNMIGSFPLGLATNASIAGVLTRIAFYNQPLDYLDRYRANVRAVTREQVKAAFEKYIHPKKMVTISVGPTASVSRREPTQ